MPLNPITTLVRSWGEFYTRREAAAYLGVTERTLRSRLAKGDERFKPTEVRPVGSMRICLFTLDDLARMERVLDEGLHRGRPVKWQGEAAKKRQRWFALQTYYRKRAAEMWKAGKRAEALRAEQRLKDLGRQLRDQVPQ